MNAGNIAQNYGVGAIVGIDASGSLYSHSVEEWCGPRPSMLVGLRIVTGNVDLNNSRNWSIGAGFGILVGGARMLSKRWSW